MDNNTFGDRLYFRRVQLGMKRQHELAAIVGVRAQTISYYESNERRPSFEMLSALADALDCSVDYLMCRVDTPN